MSLSSGHVLHILPPSLLPSLTHLVMPATCSAGHVQDWYMEMCSIDSPPPLSLVSHIVMPSKLSFSYVYY